MRPVVSMEASFDASLASPSGDDAWSTDASWIEPPSGAVVALLPQPTTHAKTPAQNLIPASVATALPGRTIVWPDRRAAAVTLPLHRDHLARAARGFALARRATGRERLRFQIGVR